MGSAVEVEGPQPQPSAAGTTDNGTQKKLADKHRRLLAQVQKLNENKIAVCEDRYLWLEWSKSNGEAIFPVFCPNAVPEPSVLILNFSGKESIIAKLFNHAFRIEELKDVTESLDSLKWILEKVGTPKSKGKESENETGVQSEDVSNEKFEYKLLSDEQESSLKSGKVGFDAVLLFCGSTLTAFQELVIGTIFLRGKPVVVLADGAVEDTCDLARKCTAGTWPVFSQEEPLIQYLDHELPRNVQLLQIIHHDIYRRLERHKSINLSWYAFSRGALAMVPFGVHALNTASLFDLCRQCMMDTGMKSDKLAQKAMATDASKAGVLEFACNSASDVYQVLVQGAILTEMVQAGSVAAAMATLDLADAFLLGSISVVTGAIAAVTAYLSRPQLVESIADVMVMLQFTYSVNPNLRRLAHSEHTDPCGNAR